MPAAATALFLILPGPIHFEALPLPDHGALLDCRRVPKENQKCDNVNSFALVVDRHSTDPVEGRQQFVIALEAFYGRFELPPGFIHFLRR